MAKKATEKIKIHAEFEVLRNELKMKLSKLTKIISRIYSKKKKQIYQRLGKPYTLSSIWEVKVNVLYALLNNSLLLFNPIKIAEIFNFFFYKCRT